MLRSWLGSARAKLVTVSTESGVAGFDTRAEGLASVELGEVVTARKDEGEAVNSYCPGVGGCCDTLGIWVGMAC